MSAIRSSTTRTATGRTPPHIEVTATTLEALLAKYQLKTLPLMKLDIEGAEIAVIQQMLEKSIYPRQLLVEFDEMNFPSGRPKKNVEETDGILRQAGYICRYFDGKANFLYVAQDTFPAYRQFSGKASSTATARQ